MAAGDLFSRSADYLTLLNPDDVIIAADKGAEYVLEMGLLPAEVHGDFDSINAATLAELRIKGVPLITYPVAKDKTDLELIAEAAIGAGYENIVILGGWGGRIDHSLGSLAVLAKIEKSGGKGVLLTPEEQVEIVDGNIEFIDCQGHRLSLLPWNCPYAEVSLAGFEYNGDKIRLKPFTTLGISNYIRESSAKLFVHSGNILLVRGFSKPFGLKESR